MVVATFIHRMLTAKLIMQSRARRDGFSKALPLFMSDQICNQVKFETNFLSPLLLPVVYRFSKSVEQLVLVQHVKLVDGVENLDLAVNGHHVGVWIDHSLVFLPARIQTLLKGSIK